MEPIKIKNYTKSKSRTNTSSFVANVFSLMFTALIISGISAVWFASEEMKHYIISFEGGLTTFGWISTLAPLGLVMMIGFGFNKYSVKFLLGIFILYSTLTGISLSTIFAIYSTSSIATTFFISALTFGIMALTGYTTKTDLTKFGSLLYMVFIGIFIASILNMFIGSSMTDFVISILGVFVFTGLTAYHMQQLKALSTNSEISNEQRSKLSLIGGLQLYILFVNLFLSLLRLLGGRD